MMSPTAEYQNLLESDAFSPCYLIALPGPLTLTTAPNDLSFKGVTYISSSLVISMDGLAATTEITSNTYTINLDNADQTALGLYGSANYSGAPVSIYLAMLDDQGALIVDSAGDGPIEYYKGIFDGWAVKETDKKSTVSIKIKSHWAAFNRKAGRFTNQSSQQERHPTDTFFQFSHEDPTEIRWADKP